MLSHFGKTGKHFMKYPVIHLILPHIKRDVKGGEPGDEILEAIELLFKEHKYLSDSYTE